MKARARRGRSRLDELEAVLLPYAMLTAMAEGIWLDTEASHFMGLRLTVNMTVLRVPGGLLVHSPLPLTPARRAEVEALGQVLHLFAPNSYHHQWLGEWARAFPSATVHGPRALARKRPELRIDRFHDVDPTRDLGDITEIPIRGFRLHETALVVGPARTAIVADLVHNVGRPNHTWTKLYTRMMGFYDRVALSRALRWSSFEDESRARLSIDALLEQPFETLIVGHGVPVARSGRDALAGALAWLAPSRAINAGAGAP